MRKQGVYILFFLFLISSVLALPVEEVQLNNYINDYTNTFTQEETVALAYIPQALHENNIAQIAVVVVDNFDKWSKEEYAIKVAHEKLGDTKEDNGVLILIGKDVREYRIDIGYGLEGDLTDAKIARMGRDLLVPAFQEGNYAQGVYDVIQAIGFELSPDGIPAPQGYQSKPSSSSNWWIYFIIIYFIMRIVGSMNENKRYYKNKKGKDVNDAFSAAVIASWFFRPPRGGSGGGFGGFGGGGFGGGGAGGSW